LDTFFAWFFRGEGPSRVISGANVQRRFIQKGTAYSTFFADNHVMDLLEAEPGRVVETLARTLGLEGPVLRSELRARSAKYLSRARRPQRADRFEAAQAAAIELLKDRDGTLGERARIIWHERFETAAHKSHATEAPDVADILELETFFTTLRRPERMSLRTVLWPESRLTSDRERFREQQLRAELLASAARLGHAFIDLYVLTIQRLGSLELRTIDAESAEEEGVGPRRIIDDYLDVLEAQRLTPLGDRAWAAFDELARVAQNFDLILDVNAPDTRTRPLAEAARMFGSLLRQQQPTGGMSGEVNKTLVQQFRMPGYPFVLVTTDLLQEGEDLHTFCSTVHHYGIAWTPSSMEQRIGRIDRVRSQTDRRLSGLAAMPDGEELLQVYYPYLEDTVEILQVQRVLGRMNTFLRLMHDGLSVPSGSQRSLDVGREMITASGPVPPVPGRLRSAFPIPEWALRGGRTALAVTPTFIATVMSRFEALVDAEYIRPAITWGPSLRNGVLVGTAKLATGRIQPFALYLRSDGERLVVRCVSPVGRVLPEQTMLAVEKSAAMENIRIGAIVGRDEGSYDLTVEEDVMLGAAQYDVARVTSLLRRVVDQADAMEQIHLPSLDQPLQVFEHDLQSEGTGTRA
jgi:hypothetical protein